MIWNYSLVQFIYESYTKMFGKTPLLERKMTELLLSAKLNGEKHEHICLFSWFLTLDEEYYYTNDDLTFFF